MIPGYYRITVQHAQPCPRCGQAIPVAAVAWWHARPTRLERVLCEGCYRRLSEAALVGLAQVREEATRGC